MREHGGTLSAEQIGQALGISRQAVDKRRKQGLLIGLELVRDEKKTPVGDREMAALSAAIKEAGERATAEAPVCWLRMEPAGEVADVRLRTWPGGADEVLATTGYHGPPVTWLGRQLR